MSYFEREVRSDNYFDGDKIIAVRIEIEGCHWYSIFFIESSINFKYFLN